MLNFGNIILDTLFVLRVLLCYFFGDPIFFYYLKNI